jgi:predicted transglutaminase-like cysteine proteinase
MVKIPKRFWSACIAIKLSISSADMRLVTGEKPYGARMTIPRYPAADGWRIMRRLMLAASVLVTSLQTPAGETLLSSQKYVASNDHEYSDYALRRIKHWQSIIQSAGQLPEPEKLQAVNDFFNDMRFISDSEHWGQDDYWATPLETLVSNGGDCEDFSIAKYFTLREMGVPLEKMRLTYVKAIDLNQAHMVLTYYETPDADPLILDNLVRQIETATNRHDLLPVYSFNADGLWLAKEHGQDLHVGSSSRLSMWNAVIERINTELLAMR